MARKQLLGAYGRDESTLSNCHIKVAYAPNQIETAEWPSKMTRQATFVTEDFTSIYTENSFDSRYFGPVSMDAIIGVARPMF